MEKEGGKASWRGVRGLIIVDWSVLGQYFVVVIDWYNE